MGKITAMEYFRVPPRWLFVKVTDEAGNVGWGEASLEGHSQAVEGCLDAWFERYTGMEADDIEHIWQMSWRTSFYRGGPVFMSALAGIDIALWDLKGEAQIYRPRPRPGPRLRANCQKPASSEFLFVSISISYTREQDLPLVPNPCFVFEIY